VEVFLLFYHRGKNSTVVRARTYGSSFPNLRRWVGTVVVLGAQKHCETSGHCCRFSREVLLFPSRKSKTLQASGVGNLTGTVNSPRQLLIFFLDGPFIKARFTTNRRTLFSGMKFAMASRKPVCI
jgi:hypothetical protein